MPSLVIRRGMKSGLQYRLNPKRRRLRLGRDASNQVQILDKKASREHAEIVFDDGWFVIRDLGSSNGTWLNSDRLEEEKPLEDGDRIRIGGVILEFTEDAEDEIEDAEVIEEAEEVEDDEEAAEGEDKAPVEVSVEVEKTGDAGDEAELEVLAEVEEETDSKDSEDLEVLAEVEEETGAKDSEDLEVLAEVEEKDAKGSAGDKESGKPEAGREEKADPALAATLLDQPGADAGGKASPEDDNKDDKGDDGQDDKPAEAEGGDAEPEKDADEDADGDKAD
jgi:pSer/pThr/pTyr-binding forkhead associated (FHA) protein